MTAENCMYWQGEGCICEIETKVKCKGATKDFVPQCQLKDEDLIEVFD
jgi:hypothetical protein